MNLGAVIGQNFGLYVGIQISMWVAVATQIGLLIPDLVYTIRTKNTMNNKYIKFLVWFICSAAWISYAILMAYDNLPIEEIVGLTISEGFNLLCLFVIYGIKFWNIHEAKKNKMTESEYCTLNYIKYVAKQKLPKIGIRSKKDLSKYFTQDEIDTFVRKAKKLHKMIKEKEAEENK